LNWTTEQAVALSAVFNALNQSGLSWLVLRNYDGLPHVNRSKDVDLGFSKTDFVRARAIIGSAMAAHGFDRVATDDYQYAWCTTYFRVDPTGSVTSIKIDILDGFVWRGAQVMDFPLLYSKRVQHRDFCVPDRVHDAFMLWTKPLMTGGFVKSAYRSDVQRMVRERPEEFEFLVRRAFGNRPAKVLWPLLESGDTDGTVKHKAQACRAAWLTSFIRAPARTLKATTEHVLRELKRRASRPRGTFCAVVGPDGVGKTTFIEELARRLSEVMVKDAQAIVILHFRPHILPNLKALFSGKSYDQSTEEFSKPHRGQPAGALGSLLRLTYYWFDYVIGYWLHVRSGCLRGKIYVFDRYFYDFIVDPRRSRLKLPHAVRVAFLHVTPQPDIVFFLDCDSSVVYARKQELAHEEIDRQLSEYRQMAKLSRTRFVRLDALQSPAEICTMAVKSFIEQNYTAAA
jgi:thymidylate kinase